MHLPSPPAVPHAQPIISTVHYISNKNCLLRQPCYVFNPSPVLYITFLTKIAFSASRATCPTHHQYCALHS